MTEIQKNELITLVEERRFSASKWRQYMREEHLPFLAKDRNVLNLPGIGKSMSFQTVGLTKAGKRILCFEHDKGRRPSDIIPQMPDIFILEKQSIGVYRRQLEHIGGGVTA